MTDASQQFLIGDDFAAEGQPRLIRGIPPNQIYSFSAMLLLGFSISLSLFCQPALTRSGFCMMKLK